jgi:hypothetical protein
MPLFVGQGVSRSVAKPFSAGLDVPGTAVELLQRLNSLVHDDFVKSCPKACMSLYEIVWTLRPKPCGTRHIDSGWYPVVFHSISATVF